MSKRSALLGSLAVVAVTGCMSNDERFIRVELRHRVEHHEAISVEEARRAEKICIETRGNIPLVQDCYGLINYLPRLPQPEDYDYIRSIKAQLAKGPIDQNDVSGVRSVCAVPHDPPLVDCPALLKALPPMAHTASGS